MPGDLDEISLRIGGLEANQKATADRLLEHTTETREHREKLTQSLAEISAKLEAVPGLARRVAAMEPSVGEFRRLKQRGVGMVTAAGLIGGVGGLHYETIAVFFRGWLGKGLILVGVIAGAAALAHADPPAGKVLDPAISAWFQDLRNPSTGAFCCNEADGHVLRDDEWRVAGDGYEVLIEGDWVPVPPEAVLQRIDNPTGGAVAFYLGHGSPFFCFVRPVEA